MESLSRPRSCVSIFQFCPARHPLLRMHVRLSTHRRRFQYTPRLFPQLICSPLFKLGTYHENSRRFTYVLYTYNHCMPSPPPSHRQLLRVYVAKNETSASSAMNVYKYFFSLWPRRGYIALFPLRQMAFHSSSRTHTHQSFQTFS